MEGVHTNELHIHRITTSQESKTEKCFHPSFKAVSNDKKIKNLDRGHPYTVTKAIDQWGCLYPQTVIPTLWL